MGERDWTPGGGLLHPVPLLAMGLLVLNDHVLKDAFASWWTGKLSDVAGMVFFPLLLQGLWEAITRRPPSPRVLALAAGATALVFGLVQVAPPVTWLYEWGLGLLQWPIRALRGLPLAPVGCTPDPSDLLAVPAVGVAWLVGRHRGAPAKRIPNPGSE